MLFNINMLTCLLHYFIHWFQLVRLRNLGNPAVDLGLHDTYYVVAHVQCAFYFGAVLAIFSRIIFNGE